MPVYEFKCSDCGHVFEVMGKYEEREKEHTCPSCGSVNQLYFEPNGTVRAVSPFVGPRQVPVPAP